MNLPNMPPFQPFAQLLVSLLTLWCSAHLFRLTHQKKTAVLKDFFRFFLFFGLFFFFLSVPGLATRFDAMVMGFGWIVGHLSLFIGLAFFVKILFGLRLPQQRHWLFDVIIVLGLLLIVLNVLNFTAPIYSNGIIDWNIHPLVGLSLAGVAALIGIAGGAFFMRGALHSQDRRVMLRSWLMAIGIWLFVVAGGLLYFAASKPEQPSLLLLASGNISEVIGILLMFFGVQFFHPPSHS